MPSNILSLPYRYGSLATLKSHKAVAKSLKFLSKLNTSKGLWVNSGNKQVIPDGSSSSSNSEDQNNCMVLVKNSKNNLQLKGESCFENQQSYGALCEAYFGHHEKIDYSCFKSIETKVMEFRIHLGPKLDTKHLSCPMHVDKRLGNTCYKKTEEYLTWNEARGLFTIFLISYLFIFFTVG